MVSSWNFMHESRKTLGYKAHLNVSDSRSSCNNDSTCSFSEWQAYTATTHAHLEPVELRRKLEEHQSSYFFCSQCMKWSLYKTRNNVKKSTGKFMNLYCYILLPQLTNSLAYKTYLCTICSFVALHCCLFFNAWCTTRRKSLYIVYSQLIQHSDSPSNRL